MYVEYPYKHFFPSFYTPQHGNQAAPNNPYMVFSPNWGRFIFHIRKTCAYGTASRPGDTLP
jgi:hypothetical protein